MRRELIIGLDTMDKYGIIGIILEPKRSIRLTEATLIL